MKFRTFKKLLSILAVFALLFSLGACAGSGSEATPTPTETQTPSPEPTATPEPTPESTPTPTPTPVEQHFEQDLALTSDPESAFPGSTMKLGADGSFELNVPGIGEDKGTYSIDGDKLKVKGSDHQYTFAEEDGQTVVTLLAGGGAIAVKFLPDAPAAKFFSRDLDLTSDPESAFPGATMKLGADGTFALNVPGIGEDKGTYAINGDKLDVKGSDHQYSFVEEDGKYVITLSAAGGAITVEFLENE